MLSILGGDYEHTLGISDDGLDYRPCELQPMWAKVRAGEPFDFAEFSLSNLIMMRDRGAGALQALPIFPNRPFAHIALRVAEHSPLKSPAEFRGLRIGVPDYSMTAAVWARGILLDEFGVHWSEIEWVTATRQRFEPPATARITRTDDDIEALCLAGKIDGLVSPHPKEEGRPASERRLRPVLRDNEGHERARFLQTGFHPINHAVIMHADVARRVADAPQRVFAAYSQAKRQAMARRLGATFMPWGEARWGEMLETFGGDPLPYGLTDANRAVVSKLIDLLAEQQLISRVPDLLEIFVPGSEMLTEAR